MSNTDQSTPLSDKIEGAPHPAQTIRIFGQEAAENEFLDVFAASRLHHGWLISGPRGVGKATLAWQITKFLLATPNHNQDVGLFGDPPKSLKLSKFRPIIQFPGGFWQGLSLVFFHFGLPMTKNGNVTSK